MNDILWDGKMDVGWDDLSILIKRTTSTFVENIRNVVEYSPNPESQALISNDSLKRFNNISDLLAEIITDGYYYQSEDDNDSNNNAKKLNAWILLGSLTESSLQMFLAFYIDDYKNTKWQQWQNIEIEETKDSIINAVNELEANGKIDKSQSKSIKEAVKDKIKEHTKEHQIQIIMLDELIKLYIHIEVFDEDEIGYLKIIQSNRNGIHSFQSREIGTWFDLQFSLRFFCYLLEWIMFRLPDLPDYE